MFEKNIGFKYGFLYFGKTTGFSFVFLFISAQRRNPKTGPGDPNEPVPSPKSGPVCASRLEEPRYSRAVETFDQQDDFTNQNDQQTSNKLNKK